MVLTGAIDPNVGREELQNGILSWRVRFTKMTERRGNLVKDLKRTHLRYLAMFQIGLI